MKKDSMTHTQSKAEGKIHPLADRVLLKPLQEKDKKSPSGIIIPESASKEKPEQGTVIAVGPGKIDEQGKIIPMHVKIGDTVLFSKYGYDEIKVDGTEYFILRQENILAVLK